MLFNKVDSSFIYTYIYINGWYNVTAGWRDPCNIFAFNAHYLLIISKKKKKRTVKEGNKSLN